jgi:preprotein translocase subunit SecY
VIALGLVVMALVVFVELSQRRIPVQYAKRMVGRRMYGGTSTYIPIKVNTAGVIPVIFASSLLYLPGLVSQFQRDSDAAWVTWINANLTAAETRSTSPRTSCSSCSSRTSTSRSRSTRTRSPRT